MGSRWCSRRVPSRRRSAVLIVNLLIHQTCGKAAQVVVFGSEVKEETMSVHDENLAAMKKRGQTTNKSSTFE